MEQVTIPGKTAEADELTDTLDSIPCPSAECCCEECAADNEYIESLNGNYQVRA
jgi:hypothetical protein